MDTEAKIFHNENHQPLEYLPKEMVGFPTLDTFDIQLDRMLGHGV